MLPLPLESAARLLSLLLSLLLHLLLRPESLLLLASVAVFWAAARHGPRLRSLPTSLRRSLRRFASRGPSTPPEPSPLTGGGPPCPPPAGVPWGAWTSAHRPRVTWQYRSRGVAVFALQGRREHMEDRFAVAHGEAAAPAGAAGEAGEAAPRCGRRHRHALYGVFDGHGGEAAAEYVKRRLPDYLRRRLAEGDGADVETALRDAVRRTEMELMETLGPAGNEAGTTCVLAVESAGRLYVANVGDSRAVLCDARGCALALSHDHKPHQLKERQRIKRAGRPGHVPLPRRLPAQAHGRRDGGARRHGRGPVPRAAPLPAAGQRRPLGRLRQPGGGRLRVRAPRRAAPRRQERGAAGLLPRLPRQHHRGGGALPPAAGRRRRGRRRHRRFRHPAAGGQDRLLMGRAAVDGGGGEGERDAGGAGGREQSVGGGVPIRCLRRGVDSRKRGSTARECSIP
ncbi:protein phosphatase 1L isoform X1 [Petromyzon marinus]|uniref:protein phosphatase 1L isoform X1 n=1 Tax=Petromyzon marinus TaxID=7757 RepID=UPI003F7021D5